MRKWIFVTFLTILIIGLILYWLNSWDFNWSQHGIEEAILSFGVWAPIGSILIMVLHTFLPFPAEFIAKNFFPDRN